MFDDTVMDKRYSYQIELVRRQYSGNAKRVIKGIGVVTCVYVNPEIDRFWIIDYRIYHPDGDGKSKLQHVQDMLRNVVYQKQLPFYAVLVWVRLKHLAYHTGQTLYNIKHNLLDEYMIQQLKNPTVQMALA